MRSLVGSLGLTMVLLLTANMACGATTSFGTGQTMEGNHVLVNDSVLVPDPRGYVYVSDLSLDGILIEVEKFANRNLPGTETVEFTLKPGESDTKKVNLEEGYTLTYALEVYWGSSARLMVLDAENHSAYRTGGEFEPLVNGTASSALGLSGELGIESDGAYYIIITNLGGNDSELIFTTNATTEPLFLLIAVTVIGLIVIIGVIFTIYKVAFFTGGNRRQRREAKRRVREGDFQNYSLDEIVMDKDKERKP